MSDPGDDNSGPSSRPRPAHERAGHHQRHATTHSEDSIDLELPIAHHQDLGPSTLASDDKHVDQPFNPLKSPLMLMQPLELQVPDKSTGPTPLNRCRDDDAPQSRLPLPWTYHHELPLGGWLSHSQRCEQLWQCSKGDVMTFEVYGAAAYPWRHDLADDKSSLAYDSVSPLELSSDGSAGSGKNDMGVDSGNESDADSDRGLSYNDDDDDPGDDGDDSTDSVISDCDSDDTSEEHDSDARPIDLFAIYSQIYSTDPENLTRKRLLPASSPLARPVSPAAKTRRLLGYTGPITSTTTTTTTAAAANAASSVLTSAASSISLGGAPQHNDVSDTSRQHELLDSLLRQAGFDGLGDCSHSVRYHAMTSR